MNAVLDFCSKPRHLVLVAILAVACAVRFYALGVPDLLHDEALVSNASRFSMEYILQRALHTDAHPPYYYWLTKAILLLGDSNAWLRAPSALAGVLGVFCVYRFGRRFFDENVGLAAGGLLAVHPLHVELSRVLRPHAIIITLGVLSCHALLEWLGKRDRKSLIRLLLINFCLLFFHFNCILIVGAQMALVGAFALAGRLPGGSGRVFIGISALNLVVSVWPLALRLGKFPGVAVNTSMLWTIKRTLANLLDLLTLAPLSWTGAIGVVLFLGGLRRLWRMRDATAAVVAAVIFLPLTALILARYGIIYSAMHIAFILPFLLLVCVVPLAGRTFLATGFAGLVVSCGAVLLFTHAFETVYAENAPLVNHNMCQRTIAGSLPAHGSTPGVTAFYNMPMLDFVNWYTKKERGDDLRNTRLRPEDASVLLTYVDQRGPDGMVWPPETLPVWTRKPDREVRVPCATIKQWRLDRTPVLRVGSLPFTARLRAEPQAFFAQVHAARNVNPVLSPLGDSLSPSTYGIQAELVYRIENDTGRSVDTLRLDFHLGEMRAGSSFDVWLAYDGEAPRRAVEVAREHHGGELTLRLFRPQGFRTLDVAVRMLCPESCASFYNIPDTPRFQGLDVIVDTPLEGFRNETPLVEGGLSDIEQGPCGPFRWGLGRETLLFFHLAEETPAAVELAASSPISGQSVDVLLDGRTLGAFHPAPWPGCDAAVSAYPFAGEPGSHLVTLRYAAWNHADGADPSATFAPGDGRTLAAAFTDIRLRLARPVEAVLTSLNVK